MIAFVVCQRLDKHIPPSHKCHGHAKVHHHEVVTIDTAKKSRINTKQGSVRIQVMFETNIFKAGGSVRAQANRAHKKATAQKTLSSGQQSGNTQRGGASRPVAYISESCTRQSQSLLGYSSSNTPCYWIQFRADWHPDWIQFSEGWQDRIQFENAEWGWIQFSSTTKPPTRIQFGKGTQRNDPKYPSIHRVQALPHLQRSPGQRPPRRRGVTREYPTS